MSVKIKKLAATFALALLAVNTSYAQIGGLNLGMLTSNGGLPILGNLQLLGDGNLQLLDLSSVLSQVPVIGGGVPGLNVLPIDSIVGAGGPIVQGLLSAAPINALEGLTPVTNIVPDLLFGLGQFDLNGFPLPLLGDGNLQLLDLSSVLSQVPVIGGGVPGLNVLPIDSIVGAGGPIVQGLLSVAPINALEGLTPVTNIVPDLLFGLGQFDLNGFPLPL